MIGGDAEISHRPRQIEIAVGIEPLDERRALIAQIAFDLEIRVERERRQLAVLHPPPELAVQGRIREVGDMRGHPRDAEAAMRMGSLFEVAPVVPIGIGHHRLPAEFMKRDILRRVACSTCMPPIEPPTTQNSVSMPKRSSNMACARTMSGIVMIGKSRAHNLPVAALVEAGTVAHMAP